MSEAPLDLQAIEAMLPGAEYTWGRDHELLITIRALVAEVRAVRAGAAGAGDPSDEELAHVWREGLPALWRVPDTLTGPLPLTPDLAAFRAALARLRGAGDDLPEPSQFEDAVVLEYPSGNWAGYLDAALATDLVPYWNAHADENQVLRAVPISSGLGPNQQERRPRAGDRPPAPRVDGPLLHVRAAAWQVLKEVQETGTCGRASLAELDHSLTVADDSGIWWTAAPVSGGPRPAGVNGDAEPVTPAERTAPAADRLGAVRPPPRAALTVERLADWIWDAAARTSGSHVTISRTGCEVLATRLLPRLGAASPAAAPPQEES